MSLSISLRSELLKTKRTAAFYFTLIGAGVVPFMLLFSTISNGLPDGGKGKNDPINFMFTLTGEILSICIFPMFVVLVCTLLPQIEYKNTTWKQVLTSPQTKLNVYISKFLNVQLLMLLFMVASYIFTWIVVVATHFILPKENILYHKFNAMQVLTDYIHIYLSVLAICAIQFLIGLRSKNFIIPIAIGIACWLAGTIMVLEYHSAISPHWPYSFHGIRLADQFEHLVPQVEWTSFGYCILILVLGFLDFKRRKMSK